MALSYMYFLDKRKFSSIVIFFSMYSVEVTLSALNAPDVDVDVEGLGDQSGGRKLDFDSGDGTYLSTRLLEA